MQKIATVQLCSLIEYTYTFLKVQNKNNNYIFSKQFNTIIYFVILDNGGRSEWIGDNFCDDINNNRKCLYDDGDCCGLSAQNNFCFKCTCICK